ncbi:hypothetical protein [Parendozoicomonas haliclonae]|uniref:Uncharacterized protein n=1 Tax=Parendozoicomonas haliclonae TaxID=1960125 RepID=A0A1X7AP14_9GAMM|nr:hypothetical protein [Parendozoicomonas haliclonae]SMA48853.1 hypothetical protein EHSB41UT_02931 [Parendozoicomonas haliclonae]
MSKPVICFSIINSVARLPDLHKLSDAGAGAGLMSFTPANNSEMIATGYDTTHLPGIEPQPLLSNGGITPALLTHALLQLFRRAGHKVVMRIYNLDLEHKPYIPEDKLALDGLEQWSCTQAEIPQLVHNTLLPNLKQEDQDDWISVVAECGVGGTIYANLWLNLLLDNPVLAAGSTLDPEKLAERQVLIEALTNRVQNSGLPITAAALLSDNSTHDNLQTAVTLMLQGLVDHQRKHPLLLAGGLMVIVPWLMLNREHPEWKAPLAGNAIQATTQWVYRDLHEQHGPDYIPGTDIPLMMPETGFHHSCHTSLQVYEQGLVVEGCGLGGCLVLAEKLGFYQQQILAIMDEFTSRHIALFEPNHFESDND